jgi:hypothetical protein
MIALLLFLALLFVIFAIYITWVKNGKSVLISFKNPLIVPKAFGFGITFSPNHPLGLVFYLGCLILIFWAIIQALFH